MDDSDYGPCMGNSEYNDFLGKACELVSRLNGFGMALSDADGGLEIDQQDLLKAYIQSPDEAEDLEKLVGEFSDRYFKSEKNQKGG